MTCGPIGRMGEAIALVPRGVFNNLPCDPIAVVGGARTLADPFDMPRFTRSTRLAIGSLVTVIGGVPK